MSKLGWGILGTGGIAKALAKAINASETGVMVGVGSRAQATADAFGAEFGVPHCYATYDELLADKGVEAVYISLPNHMHAEWMEKCARAGKHILNEKPLTTNIAEAEKALAVIKECGVFHLEAFMYRCHPQTRKVMELVNSGVLGEVRIIQANFSYNLGPKYDNIRLRQDAAGGGIMDVGCYVASYSRLIAGCEPTVVHGTAKIGEISRVDEAATASLLFPNGIVAAITCGCQQSLPTVVNVYGSEGSLTINSPWFPGPDDNVVILRQSGKDDENVIVSGEGKGLYTHEVDLVARCIAEGRTEAPSPAMTWADSLGNMRVLDAWRKSVGLVFDLEK
jgi:predicted dehydrogenase